MNTAEFNLKKSEFGIEGTGITSTTKENKTWTNKITGEVSLFIPTGSKVKVFFSPTVRPGRIFIQFGDKVVTSRTDMAYKWLTGFIKPPGIKTLEKNMWNGVSKSVTGIRVEPDGYGPDGAPAWELVLGFI